MLFIVFLQARDQVGFFAGVWEGAHYEKLGELVVFLLAVVCWCHGVLIVRWDWTVVWIG